jgi:uncharacterized protein GlcG (DUF336 family)
MIQILRVAAYAGFVLALSIVPVQAVQTIQRVSLEEAQGILQTSMAKAQEMGVRACIAVVDEQGNLVAFSRMDGARFMSIDIALHKAISSANFGVPSGPRPSAENPNVVLSLGIATTTGGKFLPVEGGVPILIDGKVVGAVGVSGGTPAQDKQIAEAGLLKALKP